jgi:hypothetical protein
MGAKILGVDIFRVTAAPIHELGLEVTDIKGGQGVLTITEFLHPPVGAGIYQKFQTTRVFDPHGVYRYVRANAANVDAGDGVMADLAALDIDVPHAVIQTAAANAVLQGVTMAAIPSGSFGWIQVKGKHFDVNVPDAVADDAWLDTAAGGAFAAAGALSDAQLQSWLTGVTVVKIADRSTLFPGAVNRGICYLRS